MKEDIGKDPTSVWTIASTLPASGGLGSAQMDITTAVPGSVESVGLAGIISALLIFAVALTRRHLAAFLQGFQIRPQSVDRWFRSSPRTATIGVTAVDFPSLPGIAEAFGREIASAAVREFARRLGRQGGAVVEAAGDHTLISYAELDTDEDWPSDRLRDLAALLSEPVSVGGCTLHPTFRMGSTSGSNATHRAEGLAEEARIAMAETADSSPSLFRSDQRRAQDRRRQRLREISAGLDRGEFVPFFQPLVDALDGHVIGVEALARWQRDSGEVETPDRFLGLVTAAGLLPALGQAMVTQATAAVAGWRASGLDVPSLSINFSAEELGDPDMPDRLAFALDRAGLRPEDLRVEVLETTVLGAADDPVERSVRRLHALGVQVDLDDFGAGPASIALIGRLDIDRLKIDRGVIAALDRRPKLRALAKGMIDMARALEIEVLAEGVETEAEHAVLRRLGCDGLQGHWIAPPMPAERLPDWLAERQMAAAPDQRMGVAG